MEKSSVKKEGEYDSAFAAIKETLDVIQEEQRDHRALTNKLVEVMESFKEEMRDMKRVESSLVQSQASTDRITSDHEGRLTKIEGHLELV